MKDLLWFALYIGNIPFSLGLLEHITPVLLIAWTLCIEEQFYLVQPWVVRYLSRKEKFENSLALFAVAVIFFSLVLRVVFYFLYKNGILSVDFRNFINTFTLTQIDSIAFGVLLATLARKRNFLTHYAPKISLPVFGILLVFGYYLIVKLNSYSTVLTFTLGLTLINMYWMFFVLRLLYVNESAFDNKIMDWMRRVGKNGYCLYLVHQVALILAYEILPPVVAASASSGTLLYFSRVGVALVISIIIAWGLYVITEVPFMKLRERFRSPQTLAVNNDNSLERVGNI